MSTNEPPKLLGNKRKQPHNKDKDQSSFSFGTLQHKQFDASNTAFLTAAKTHPLTLSPPLTPIVHPTTSSLHFKVHATFNRARASTLTLPHSTVLTPIYMPVGTKATMKGLLSYDMYRMGCKLMLSNTYHIALEPGDDFLTSKFGLNDNRGIHHYMNWSNSVLTDSGGFQIVSLSQLSIRSENGVEFVSHIHNDNRRIMLTPEKSMQIQNNIGSDIIMAFDDVIRPTSTINEIYDSCERSLRWIDRCITAHQRKNEQNLFGIIQGGLDLDLRKQTVIEMNKRNLPGYAIGGLAGGETKEEFWKVVDVCTQYMPKDKPRYLMGVGYPVDLVICALLGVDMFDCVFATRTARFGTAFTNYGFVKLKAECNKYCFDAIDKECECEVCKTYTRSYFYFMLNKNSRAVSMISYHNVYYLLTLMGRVRQSIIDNKVNEFCEEFFTKMFDRKYPQWIYEALKKAGVDVSFIGGNTIGEDDINYDYNE